MPYAFNEPGLQSEVAPYTWQDFWAEMGDPKVILRDYHRRPSRTPEAGSTKQVPSRGSGIGKRSGFEIVRRSSYYLLCSL